MRKDSSYQGWGHIAKALNTSMLCTHCKMYKFKGVISMDWWAEHLHTLILLEGPSLLWGSRDITISHCLKEEVF